MNRDEANQAVAALADAKRGVALASKAPLWRHLVFAAGLALVTLSAALEHPARIVPWVVAMVAFGFLFWWDRRQTGMFVNGYRRGRTLPLTIGLLVAMLGFAVAAGRLRTAGEEPLAFLMVAGAFIVALFASLWWERIFLTEMGAAR